MKSGVSESVHRPRAQRRDEGPLNAGTPSTTPFFPGHHPPPPHPPSWPDRREGEGETTDSPCCKSDRGIVGGVQGGERLQRGAPLYVRFVEKVAVALAAQKLVLDPALLVRRRHPRGKFVCGG